MLIHVVLLDAKINVNATEELLWPSFKLRSIRTRYEIVLTASLNIYFKPRYKHYASVVLSFCEKFLIFFDS